MYIFFQEVSEHEPSVHVLAPRSIEVKLEIQGSRWGSAYDYRERCGGEVKSLVIHWAIRALSSDISFHVRYFPRTVYARAMRQCGCQGLNPSPSPTIDLKGLHSLILWTNPEIFIEASIRAQSCQMLLPFKRFSIGELVLNA